MAVSTTRAVEAGREVPNLKTARKLAQALGVDPIEIDEAKQAAERAAPT